MCAMPKGMWRAYALRFVLCKSGDLKMRLLLHTPEIRRLCAPCLKACGAHTSAFFCFFILSLFWGAVSVKIGFVKGSEIFFEPFPFFASNIKCI